MLSRLFLTHDSSVLDVRVDVDDPDASSVDETSNAEDDASTDDRSTPRSTRAIARARVGRGEKRSMVSRPRVDRSRGGASVARMNLLVWNADRRVRSLRAFPRVTRSSRRDVERVRLL